MMAPRNVLFSLSSLAVPKALVLFVTKRRGQRGEFHRVVDGVLD